MTIRDARASDIEPLTSVWFESWHLAHDLLVPSEIVALRTPDSFRHRLRDGLATVRVAGPPGQPTGLCIVHDDELNQLFVAASARGTGIAAELEADAERRFRDAGVRTAWLACAIGNLRAARFYEKRGWRRVADMICELHGGTGPVPLETWRYEKRVPLTTTSPPPAHPASR